MTLLSLVSCGVAVGLPATAQAKCAMPTPTLAPPFGKVPANPVLWLIMPHWQAEQTKHLPRLRAKAKGVSIPIVVKADTKSGNMNTYRVELTTSAAGPLTIELLGEQPFPAHRWSLEVDPAWQAPAIPTEPIEVRHEVNKWVCSHTRTRNLQFVATAWAYRVVAAPSREALAQGQGKAFVVPRSIMQMWDYEAKSVGAKASLSLGYANCLGDTFDWQGGAVVASVLALLPDGSEKPVNSTPLSIDPP